LEDNSIFYALTYFGTQWRHKVPYYLILAFNSLQCNFHIVF
jgi:hypothetical protein